MIEVEIPFQQIPEPAISRQTFGVPIEREIPLVVASTRDSEILDAMPQCDIDKGRDVSGNRFGQQAARVDAEPVVGTFVVVDDRLV